MDAEVLVRYQVSGIKDLVEEKGIAFFRQAESETLKKLDLQNAVISTGGGTPCYLDNMDWMKEHGTVAFLYVDEKSLFNRLKTTNLHDRPLLRGLDDDGLRKFIHQKLQERMPFYSQADVVFKPVQSDMNDFLAMLDSKTG